MSRNPHNEGPDLYKQRFDAEYKQFMGKQHQRNRLGIDSPGHFYETMHKDRILSGVAGKRVDNNTPGARVNNYSTYSFGKAKRSVIDPHHKKLGTRISPGRSVKDDIN